MASATSTLSAEEPIKAVGLIRHPIDDVRLGRDGRTASASKVWSALRVSVSGGFDEVSNQRAARSVRITARSFPRPPPVVNQTFGSRRAPVGAEKKHETNDRPDRSRGRVLETK